jgi:hypothetical protein
MGKENLSGFDVYGIEYARDGTLVTPADAEQLVQATKAASGDVLVLSHGWNNDKQEASTRYYELLRNLRQQMPDPGPVADRPLLVVALYWPSKRFADDDLIPGGAASVDDTAAVRIIAGQLSQLRSDYPTESSEAQVFSHLITLVDRLDDSADAADDFVRLLRSIFPTSVNAEEPVLEDDFFKSDGSALLQTLGRRFRLPLATGGAAGAGVPMMAQGGAAGLGNVFAGVKNGARNLLNLFTYYTMKERAGIVGATGARELVRGLQGAGATVHLVGHSFGGRLVSALIGSPMGVALSAPIGSLTLLQSAFSHWAFAPRYDGEHDGLFCSAFTQKRVRGATLVTYTPNDRAVGLAYPIASRLKRQVASGLGDAADPYGAIGRNGAQRSDMFVNTDECALRDVGSPYTGLRPGMIHNLEASTYVPDHGSVWSPQIAHAVLAAMRSVPA